MGKKKLNLKNQERPFGSQLKDKHFPRQAVSTKL